MSDVIRPPADPSWRLITPNDTQFLYYLVTKVDPRWWRFSRHGLEPSQLVRGANDTAAGAIVINGHGLPIACALLADAGASGTGMLEYFALPNPDAQALARRFAHELVAAAFAGTPIRQLYYERLENDPDVLGEVAALFEVEVTFPDFAMIDGRYEARTTSVLTADRFTAAQKVPEGSRLE